MKGMLNSSKQEVVNVDEGMLFARFFSHIMRLSIQEYEWVLVRCEGTSVKWYSWERVERTRPPSQRLSDFLYYSPIAHLINPRGAAWHIRPLKRLWSLGPMQETFIDFRVVGVLIIFSERRVALSNFSPPGIPWATAFPLKLWDVHLRGGDLVYVAASVLYTDFNCFFALVYGVRY